jgi:hypothetical protein
MDAQRTAHWRAQTRRWWLALLVLLGLPAVACTSTPDSFAPRAAAEPSGTVTATVVAARAVPTATATPTVVPTTTPTPVPTPQEQAVQRCAARITGRDDALRETGVLDRTALDVWEVAADWHAVLLPATDRQAIYGVLQPGGLIVAHVPTPPSDAAPPVCYMQVVVVHSEYRNAADAFTLLTTRFPAVPADQPGYALQETPVGYRFTRPPIAAGAPHTILDVDQAATGRVTVRALVQAADAAARGPHIP